MYLASDLLQQDLIIAIFFAVVGIILLVNSIQRLFVKKRKDILLLSLSLQACVIPNLVFVLYPNDLTKNIMTAALLLGLTLGSIILLIILLKHMHPSKVVSPKVLVLFLFIPFFSQISFWLLNSAAINSDDSLINILSLIEKINSLYRYSLLTTVFWLIWNKRDFLQININRKLFVYIGPMALIILDLIHLLGFEWSSLSRFYILAIILCTISVLYVSSMNLTSGGRLIERENIIENMNEGWIVVNMENKVVDINLAIEQVLDIKKEKILGRSIDSIFSDFHDINFEDSQIVEMEKSISTRNEWKYLNFRISVLKDDYGKCIGRLVLWRDITDRRRVGDARQRARDELFVLLSTISSIASQATNLSEFLSETIYQIVLPFRSQVMAIYLLDERADNEKFQTFYLASQIGFSSESLVKLNSIPTLHPIMSSIIQERKPIIIGASEDGSHFIPMQSMELSYLLTIPLIVPSTDNNDREIIGLICLGRREALQYGQDEIIRLTILAEQIATLIDNDRKRKLAITISERQRLMRDIHDSVSQKLYGLVAITEAAQATLEAGSKIDIFNVLSRTGDYARQAVKELRLFLFQMQPIDLEKDGLVSVLHHRLAAVEGRADIKVRFLADDNISLAKRNETVLYFIAQEALNNILRHAKAKSVSVSLKQGRKYVTLEISDDGCGFEPDKPKPGGMGLTSIKDRVRLADGKLNILSKPGQGTTIIVSLEKEKIVNTKQKGGTKS